MSGYTGQDNNYWAQSPPQGQYNFDASGFGQLNQQFEFQTYTEQSHGDYSYSQKSFLDPTQSPYSGNLYTQDDYAKGRKNTAPCIIQLLNPRSSKSCQRVHKTSVMSSS